MIVQIELTAEVSPGPRETSESVSRLAQDVADMLDCHPVLIDEGIDF